MKKQFLTFALSIAILLGGAIPAYALDNNMVGTHTITRASQYLDGYSVGIEARGNGKIAVAIRYFQQEHQPEKQCKSANRILWYQVFVLTNGMVPSEYVRDLFRRMLRSLLDLGHVQKQ